MSPGVKRAMPAALLPVLLMILASCSVKEDRRACPCYTYLIVDEFIDAGFPRALISFSSGGEVARSVESLPEHEHRGYVRPLPRRPARAAVVAGLERTVIRGDSLVTPFGLEADPLWMYGEEFVCESDEKFVTAVPYKQYCTLTIVVSGLGPGEEYEGTFRVRAADNAIDIYSRRPLRGEYLAVVRRSGTGVFSVRIPRQSGNDMILEFVRETAGKDGTVDRVIDLGAEFSRAGYDWKRKNLQDVSAVVDHASAEITLSVPGWDEDESFGDIEI